MKDTTAEKTHNVVQKPTNCIGCPLYDRPIVFSEKPKTVLPSYLWIVGEAPGYTEVSIGRPFVGKAGELLRTSFDQIGLNEPVVITNACLCHPDQNKTPSIKAITKCQFHLDQLASKYPPKFIVALGLVACKALGLKTTKLDEMRGKLYKTKYGDCLVTYHPSRILRSKYRLNSLFILDLKKAVHLMRTRKTTPLTYDLAVEYKAKNKDDKITTLTNQQDIISVLQSVPHDEIKAIDIETSIPNPDGTWPEWGVNPYHPLNGIYSVAIAWGNEVYSFPVDPKVDSEIKLDGDSNVIKAELKRVFSTTKNWIAHNCKFEMQMLKHHLSIVPDFTHDTQILAYLIRETLQGFYSLKSLVDVYLPESSGYKDVRKTDLLTYNALDALYTLKLFHALSRELIELPQRDHIINAEKFLIQVVIPLICDVEIDGVYIDWKKLISYKNKVLEVKNKVEEKIKELTGVNNPRTVQFRKMFEQILTRDGIVVPKTDTGMPDMSADTLKGLVSKAYTEDVKRLIYYKLTHTKLDKSLTAYLDKYPEFLNEHTKRIHPIYRPDGTVTGRLSSEKPNFQQIPREGLSYCPNCYIVADKTCPLCESKLEELINISKLISTPAGKCLISADYSQMEVRVLAHITQDETLIDIIKKGIDLHSYTASKIYKIPYEEIVTKKDTNTEIKKMRQFAKSATFGIIYGITAQGLALGTGTTVTEAQNMINKFYETYPKVKAWIDHIHQFVQENKYVVSPIGRVRRFDSPKITNDMLREAQNFPIQSYASDLTLAAAWKVAKEIKQFDAKVVGLVHDSIKIECPIQHLEVVKEKLVDVMTNWVANYYKISVPLETDIDVHFPDETFTDLSDVIGLLKTETKGKKGVKNKKNPDLPLLS